MCYITVLCYTSVADLKYITVKLIHTYNEKQTTETDAAAIAGSNMLAADLSKLRSKLEKVEKELSKCRTSTIEDGWQTQKFARKSRRWDFYAQQKHEISLRINEIEAELKINTEGHQIRLPQESSFDLDHFYN